MEKCNSATSPASVCLCARLTLSLCLVACNPDVSGWVYIRVAEIRICEEPHEKSYSAARIRTKVWGCNVCLFSSCCPPLSLTVAQWPRYNVSACMYAVCTCWIHCCNTAGMKMCVGDVIVSFPRNTAGGKFGEHAKVESCLISLEAPQKSLGWISPRLSVGRKRCDD